MLRSLRADHLKNLSGQVRTVIYNKNNGRIQNATKLNKAVGADNCKNDLRKSERRTGALKETLFSRLLAQNPV